MFNKHKFHVLKNAFNYIDLENNDKLQSKIDFKNYKCLVLDTESCTKVENDNTGAKIYGWGLGCIYTDHMIYGQNLVQLMDTFKMLYKKDKLILRPSVRKNRKTKSYPKQVYTTLTIAIHNLKWDFEFFKYVLSDLGYSYLPAHIMHTKDYQKAVTQREDKTYHIVQNNGVVYGAEVFTDKVETIKNRDGSLTDICLRLDFFDFAKIVVDSVENFPKYLNKGTVNEMFYKMKQAYDYKTYRHDNHIQDMLELRYQYNDIYMLRKVIEEYYIKIMLNGNIDDMEHFRTQSSIAFNNLKKKTFTNTDDYNKEYREYFELDKKTSFEHTRKRLERESYKGGFTHCGSLYLGKDIKKRGCSLDINSSYPHKMASELLPYGRPIKGKYHEVPQIDKDNQVFLIEVGFDYVEPKSSRSQLEVFKIGAENIKPLSKIVGDVSGQEYFYTNITKDRKVVPVYAQIKDSHLTSNYQMVITSAEYDFFIKNYNFGTFNKDKDGFIIDRELTFNGLEIGESLIYKAEREKMKPFVDYYTEQKIYNKKIGNTSLTQSAKTNLNSSYGKFGTKVIKEERDMIFNQKQGVYKWTSLEGGEYEGQEYYYPMASFITSYGRLMLWKAIVYAIGVENFIYCDTDSIYCFLGKHEVIRRMRKQGFIIDPYILGGWDIESNFDRFKAIGQKKYMYHSIDYKKGHCKGNQIRCCGLPKIAQEEISKQGFEEFYLGKEVEGKLAKVCVNGGALLLEVKFKLQKINW